MISVEDFKNFLGYQIDAIEAKNSLGLLVLTRTNPTGTVVPIPSDLVYMASGQSFVQANRDVTEINESQLFIEVSVQARHAGLASNIEADQVWTMDQVVSFTASNPNSFSEGQDAKPEVPGVAPMSLDSHGHDDDRLQACINIGKAIVRQLAGDSTTGDNELFANPLLKEAVLLVAMYRLQNINTAEVSSSFGDGGLSTTVTQLFRDRSFLPLMTQVETLISQSGKRNLSLWFDGIFEPTNSQVAKF